MPEVQPCHLMLVKTIIRTGMMPEVEKSVGAKSPRMAKYTAHFTERFDAIFLKSNVYSLIQGTMCNSFVEKKTDFI